MKKIISDNVDIVSGWRKKRYDNYIKKIPSKVANFLIAYLMKQKLHDYGCTLKIYKGNLIRKIKRYLLKKLHITEMDVLGDCRLIRT